LIRRFDLCSMQMELRYHAINIIEVPFNLRAAFWSEFASAFAAQVHSLCASVTAVYLPFFVFGRVLTRLD